MEKNFRYIVCTCSLSLNLARCYVVVKLSIRDTVYDIQTLTMGFMSICLLLYNFRGPGEMFVQFLRAKNMFIVSVEAIKGLENSYQPIPRFVCNIKSFHALIYV